MLSRLATIMMLLSFSLAAHSGLPKVNGEIESQYPGPWKTDFNMKVTKALSQYGARGCGIIIYRTSRNSESEFLAACSTDNENWKAYMVWPNIGEVMGPYTLN